MNLSSVFDTLDKLGFDVFRNGISLLWQSSILFIGVAALCRILRRTRAGVKHRIWVMSLLVAPLLPFLTWGASKFNTPRAPIRVIRQYAEPIRAPEPVELPMVAENLPSGPESEPLPSHPKPSFSLLDYPWALLLLVYVCGLSFFVGLTVRAWYEMGKWVKRGARVDLPRTQAAFREACPCKRELPGHEVPRRGVERRSMVRRLSNLRRRPRLSYL